MLYPVLNNLSHNSRRYKAGEEVEMDDAVQAQALIALGIIGSPVPESDASTTKSEKGKKAPATPTPPDSALEAPPATP